MVGPDYFGLPTMRHIELEGVACWTNLVYGFRRKREVGYNYFGPSPCQYQD